MKKTYMKPTLEVVKIATTQMLAVSLVDGFNSFLDDSGIDAEEALARDIFDFEEDDAPLDFE